ncbi:TetR/AcrR family transcriptional regulator [Gryllotalpicola protaetiae]|uniref:TetR/AcrR family transcriptional regulator n=1 Tax=Gryllotalpicola protaetiae TaxID=2419771 RepID=A0A387BU00_9MICO|nr:TetR/AcrR family transcriptional regulator [Gryllotalpicola protaetiae]AYG04417.1 TetR/AcrR family transcriptional regulator [Gryllotalpicola protaetiae]
MADQSEPALPHAIALAWGVAANPQRGPRRELSIERIVEVAVGLADSEGLGAVSMARVAQELGYTTMSLYRYVTAKDDLLKLMQDAVSGIDVPAAAGEDWRAELRTWTRAMMAQLGAHPWMTELPITGIPMMPNELRTLDAALAALARTPLSALEKMATILVVANHARVAVAIQHQIASAGVPVEQATGEAYESALRELLDPAEYPELRKVLDAGQLSDREFDDAGFGLERILDGIAAYLAAKKAGAAEPVAAPDPDLVHYAKDQKVKDAVQRRREAEKSLREAQKHELEALKNARERAAAAAEREAARAERERARARANRG